jgi:hypothetical protein
MIECGNLHGKLAFLKRAGFVDEIGGIPTTTGQRIDAIQTATEAGRTIG